MCSSLIILAATHISSYELSHWTYAQQSSPSKTEHTRCHSCYQHAAAVPMLTHRDLDHDVPAVSGNPGTTDTYLTGRGPSQSSTPFVDKYKYTPSSMARWTSSCKKQSAHSLACASTGLVAKWMCVLDILLKNPSSWITFQVSELVTWTATGACETLVTGVSTGSSSAKLWPCVARIRGGS